jgi:geranylgeranyl pyrophosphate synthase
MSTETGAAMSQAPEESIQILIKYGYNLGIAFQIVDDILDFIGTEEELGKPAGSDLGQGTITLPSMLLLERYPNDNPLKKLADSKDRQKEIKRAIEMVRNSSIIQECQQVAEDYCAEACRNLKLLPDKVGRRSLMELAQFVVRRRK